MKNTLTFLDELVHHFLYSIKDIRLYNELTEEEQRIVSKGCFFAFKSTQLGVGEYESVIYVVTFDGDNDFETIGAYTTVNDAVDAILSRDGVTNLDHVQYLSKEDPMVALETVKGDEFYRIDRLEL